MVRPPSVAANPAEAIALLDWYDRSHRKLPWRAPPGQLQVPYRVWLSEIMLQQTTVRAVAEYYLKFIRLWPDVAALAAAPDEAVMAAWAGLGYYSRARNLLACARIVAGQHGGVFPDTEAALLKLPGIGPYTAAAIAAIAFGRRAVVVDGNVERVISRHFAISAPLPGAKPAIRQGMDQLTPEDRAGDFAQAMMDLGATICTPRRPACALCPLRPTCAGYAKGIAESLPAKTAKGERPVRHGAAFVALDPSGYLLVRTRPPRGLLGGMTEVPGTDWRAGQPASQSAGAAPLEGDWRPMGTVTHVFTHFELQLAVFRADAVVGTIEGGRWLPPHQVPGAAFPTVFRKVLAKAGVS